MKNIKALFILLTIITLMPKIYGQKNPIVIGTIESNYLNWEQLKDNPYFVFASFVKYKGGWEVLNVDSSHLENLDFNVFSDNKIVGRIKTKLNTVMRRMAFVDNSYRILSKDIPHVGKKSAQFSGSSDIKIYRPLVISTMNFSSRHNKISYRPLTKNDSMKIVEFLESEAIKLKLGKLPDTKNLINQLKATIYLNDTVYFISADINLNMYCYSEQVSFARDTMEIDEKNNLIWSSLEPMYASKEQFTPNGYFLVVGGKVSYIDNKMSLLDFGDYDNDGYEEIIFRVKKYNYDGYLMICEQWKNVVKKGWSYH